MERILLAFSGDLSTSVALAWLCETQRAEVVALVVDVGQGRHLEDVRERAVALGAARAHVLDVRDEYASEFILPALQASALDRQQPSLMAAMSRPVIARKLVEIARIEGSSAIAHGSDAGDRAPLSRLLRSIDPDLKILAPVQMAGLSRSSLIGFATQRGIPVPGRGSTSARVPDANLLGRTVVEPAPDHQWADPPESLYLLTKSPEEAPDSAACVDVEFAAGVPVKINGIPMSLVELIQSLETIAGSHGVGRLLQIESAQDGRLRRIVEAPAALLLHAAHRDLQRAVTAPELHRLTSSLALTYADLIERGDWFTSTRDAIDALVGHVQQSVNGGVRLKLFKGDCRVAGIHTQVQDAVPAL